MNKIKAIFAALVAALRAYPNSAAIGVSIVIAVAAKFGLALTANDVLVVFSFASVFLSTLAHYSYRTHEATAVETAKREKQ